MATRDFNNPNQLPLKILERRFAQSDDSATFVPVIYTPPADVGGPQRHIVGIESALSDDQINSLLSGALTTAEQDYMTEFDTDRQNFRSQYQTTISQLQTIENNNTPTNAQVIGYVQFLARTMRLLLRLLVKTRFDSK